MTVTVRGNMYLVDWRGPYLEGWKGDGVTAKQRKAKNELALNLAYLVEQRGKDVPLAEVRALLLELVATIDKYSVDGPPPEDD